MLKENYYVSNLSKQIFIPKDNFKFNVKINYRERLIINYFFKTKEFIKVFDLLIIFSTQVINRISPTIGTA